MNYINKFFRLIGFCISTRHYYRAMNSALKSLNGNYTMLHYPMKGKENSSFLQCQKNLIDYCISKLPELKGKEVLDVGCGNGIQGLYIYEQYSPKSFTGVDLSYDNIKIATELTKTGENKSISFKVDDAQNLTSINDNSFDIVLNVESAFSYPDKLSFFKEVFRVLKPGGHFIIADIVSKSERKINLLQPWKKKMGLNHWPAFKYIDNIERAKLSLLTSDNITSLIIEGYRNYKTWLSDLKNKPFVERLILKVFFIFNIRLNVMLLQKHRDYFILYGRKSQL